MYILYTPSLFTKWWSADRCRFENCVWWHTYISSQLQKLLSFCLSFPFGD